MSSEVGVLPVEEEKIVQKWRLQPGKMLLIDLEEGRIVSDDEIKRQLSTANPYKDWLHRTQIVLEDLPGVRQLAPVAGESLLDRQQAFGYTQEDIKLLMTPMATVGQEAIGSMGTDTPISASVRQVEAALYILQAELRTGHQPADRSDPRRTGDEPCLLHWAAPEHLRPQGPVDLQAPGSSSADPDQRGSGEDPRDW